MAYSGTTKITHNSTLTSSNDLSSPTSTLQKTYTNTLTNGTGGQRQREP